MIKKPPQLAADPIMAGVNPRYNPKYPSCWITPRTVVHIVLGLLLLVTIVLFFVDELFVVIDATSTFLCRTEFRRRSSTCIRTLTKSNGYNSIVDADPPAIPARKEDSGVDGILN